MRWKKPKEGQTRTKSRFLWFPKTIYGETRWLEKATWKEEYTMYGNWKLCYWIIEIIDGPTGYIGSRSSKYCNYTGPSGPYNKE